MKPKVTVIEGKTKSGRKGIAYRHNIAVGARVRLPDGRIGTVIGPGMAGMPEVKTGKGSCFYSPDELEILDS